MQHERDTQAQRLSLIETKLAETAAWRDALKTGIGQRWQVLNEPELPVRPQGPTQLLLIPMAIILAGFGATGTIILAVIMSPRIRDSLPIQAKFGQPPIVAFPEFARASGHRSAFQKVSI